MTTPHVGFTRTGGTPAVSHGEEVRLKIGELEDLFREPGPDPLNGRFETRSGFDRLLDDVEPSVRPLLVHLAVVNDTQPVASEEAVAHAIAGVAQGRIAQLRVERRRIRSLGLKELAFGAAFLALCLVVGSAISAFDFGPNWLRHFAVEGLVIVGWISLWHPVDMLFFARLPITREQRSLTRIVSASVRISYARNNQQ